MPKKEQSKNLSLTPGERLKLARETKGLSLAEVASQLRLSQQYVIDIEKDDYKHAPGLIYVRGYLRSYARLLELSEEQILTAFNALKVEHLFESKVLPEPPVYKQTSRMDYRKHLLAGGGVAIFLLLLLLMMFHGLHKKHIQQAQATAPIKNTQQLALKSDAGSTVESTTESSAQAPSEATAQATTESASKEAPQATATESAPEATTQTTTEAGPDTTDTNDTTDTTQQATDSDSDE